MMFLSSISTPSIEGFSHPRTSIFPSISQGSWIFPSKTWIFPSKTSISQGSVTVISRSRFQDCCDLWWLSPGGPGGEMAKGRRMVEFHQKPAEIVILTYNVYVYIYIYLLTRKLGDFQQRWSDSMVTSAFKIAIYPSKLWTDMQWNQGNIGMVYPGLALDSKTRLCPQPIFPSTNPLSISLQ